MPRRSFKISPRHESQHSLTQLDFFTPSPSDGLLFPSTAFDGSLPLKPKLRRPPVPTWTSPPRSRLAAVTNADPQTPTPKRRRLNAIEEDEDDEEEEGDDGNGEPVIGNLPQTNSSPRFSSTPPAQSSPSLNRRRRNPSSILVNSSPNLRLSQASTPPTSSPSQHVRVKDETTCSQQSSQFPSNNVLCASSPIVIDETPPEALVPATKIVIEQTAVEAPVDSDAGSGQMRSERVLEIPDSDDEDDDDEAVLVVTANVAVTPKRTPRTTPKKTPRMTPKKTPQAKLAEFQPGLLYWSDDDLLPASLMGDLLPSPPSVIELDVNVGD